MTTRWRHTVRSTLLPIVLWSIIVSGLRATDSRMPFDDMNAFLGNSVRSDLIGPEMWTAHLGLAARENDSKVFVGGQMPVNTWPAPTLGLSDHLHVVHGTEFHDAIRVETAEWDHEKRTVLRLIPTRNVWTPARLTTYYRSAPNALGTDFPYGGSCGVKETKCITSDNVFIAELEVGNYSPRPKTIELRILVRLQEQEKSLKKVAAGELSTLSGAIRFTTEAMGRKTPRNGFAAAIFTASDFATKMELSPWQRKKLRYGFAIRTSSAPDAVDAVKKAIDDENVFAKNVVHFNDWFQRNVPPLHVRNCDVLKMYYHRWFVVYRGCHEARRLLPNHEYPRPVMYESPAGGWYGCVIGLPVPIQIQEAAWLRDPNVGWNHILNWADGVIGYRGYIQFTPMAAWRFYKCHPDREKLLRSFDAMKKFSLDGVGRSFDRLPVQSSSWLTGAEYQPNFYQFTTPPWDFRNDCELYQSAPGLAIAQSIRLDTAGFAIANLSAVGRMAGALGKAKDQKTFAANADAMLDIVKKKHWDSKLGLFLSADPATGRLADQAACYDSFVPYMWGMIREPEYFKAFDKLTDTAWFADDFPISTTAKTCPMYFDNNAEVGPTQASLVKPHCYGASWNGPTWNFANSLIAEAFGRGALARAELRGAWLDFFARWTDMQFLYGDRSTPFVSEHHRPSDGARLGGPSEYFHSSWIDPFISYWCGIRLQDDLSTLIFDPFSPDEFSLSTVPLAGREYSFEQKVDSSTRQRELTVYDSNGRALAKQTGSRPLTLSLPASDRKKGGE